MTNPNPFKEEETGYVLAVVLDMSGSFSQYMQSDDPRAYRFFMRVAQKFFQERMGDDSRILLAQLSTGNRCLLWDGKAANLRRRFPTPAAFAKFLQEKSTDGGSNCYAAVADTLNYLTHRPGITDNTTLLTIVLSDLLDNDANAAESKARLLDALRRYRDRNGYIGFYWVDQTAIDEWNQILDDAGFPPRVWMDIIDDPELPDFED